MVEGHCSRRHHERRNNEEERWYQREKLKWKQTYRICEMYLNFRTKLAPQGEPLFLFWVDTNLLRPLWLWPSIIGEYGHPPSPLTRASQLQCQGRCPQPLCDRLRLLLLSLQNRPDCEMWFLQEKAFLSAPVSLVRDVIHQSREEMQSCRDWFQKL